MVSNASRFEQINVLASEASWAWPRALDEIFRPREVNLLVAGSAGEFVNIIESRRIHTAIVDMDWEKSRPLATVKIIRASHPLLPCIVLTRAAGEAVLSKALQLSVFSVIDKPVDMAVLREQLDRLFMKRYNCDVFS